MKPRLVAYIPVRGGSKGIPGKNIKIIAGRPLLHWTLEAAVQSRAIERVFVGTDDSHIANAAREFNHPKITVVDRPPETVTDTASTESALMNFASRYDFQHVAVIQATSPLTRASDLDNAWDHLHNTGADSLVSVVRQKRFIWCQLPDGSAAPQNYRPNNRPRRQDWDGFLVENGAFYLSSHQGLLSSGCRLHGKVVAYEMSEESYVELDEPVDWVIIERLLASRQIDHQTKDLDIRLFLSDVDGVLTDGGMYYGADGSELKKFNTRDGHGLSLLGSKGILTGLITGENTTINTNRAKKLGITIIEQGIKDKLACVSKILEIHGLGWNQLAYIGDDLNDLEVLRRAGWSAAPSDAEPVILNEVKYICKRPGGRGCVREAADYLLQGRVPSTT